MGKPKIAIIGQNTLTNLGLRGIIEKMMPNAESCLFNNFDELVEAGPEQFYHYFISTQVLMECTYFFKERSQKTIVLVHGQDINHISEKMTTVNMCQPEPLLVRSILKMAESAHKASHASIINEAKKEKKKRVLTSRETEVLRLIVTGNINKEIAQQLNVSLTTIITHRKNITAKLNMKSVASLTIYAVTHGIVQAEEI